MSLFTMFTGFSETKTTKAELAAPTTTIGDAEIISVSPAIVTPEENVSIVAPTIKSALPAKMSASFMTGVIGRVATDLFLPSQFKFWDNVAIAGGYVIDLLFNSTTSSDIDLFVYNTNTDQVKKIAEVIISLLKRPSMICETKAVRTVKANGKTIQIINGSSFSDLNEVLDSFDLNCCKVAFDGYNMIIHPNALPELTNCIINYDNIPNQYMGTSQRLLKYVTTKGFGLTVKRSTYDSMYPLYMFTESNGLEYVQRMYNLRKDPSLLADYKKLVIRLIPELMTNGASRARSTAGAASASVIAEAEAYVSLMRPRKRDSQLMAGNSLSCCVSTVRMEMEPTNKFGLPEILYRIKTGFTPTLDELYTSIAADMCGFHVTCYLIFYHPDEEFIMEFVKESHRLSSKNMNIYGLSYLELSCLLNRLKLAKFFMTKSTYKTAMAIARIEDNVELYKLAYKSFCSDDRYFYKREDLIQFNAVNLLRYLYDEEIPSRQSSATTTSASNTSDKIRELVDACETDEDFLLLYGACSISADNLIEWLRSRSTVELDDVHMVYANLDIYNKLRTLVHEYHNRETSDKYLRYYSFLTKYIPATISTDSLDSPGMLYTLLRIQRQKILDTAYEFNNLYINLLLIDMDDCELLNTSSQGLELYKFLKTEKKYLGPNLTSLYLDLAKKEDYVTTYKELLRNTEDHDQAYADNVLSTEYQRTENAIGYAPDDIILWRTIMFYVNTTTRRSGAVYIPQDPDSDAEVEDEPVAHPTSTTTETSSIDWYSSSVVERRKSVRAIDRTRPYYSYSGH